jgi:hypothetical protein
VQTHRRILPSPNATISDDTVLRMRLHQTPRRLPLRGRTLFARSLASLVLLAAPLLSSCASFGVDEVWASPDSSGTRHWKRFPLGTSQVTCIAKYSSGRADRTMTVGLRRCGATCGGADKVGPPILDENGAPQVRNDPGVVILAEYAATAKGIGSQYVVNFAAKDPQSGKAGTIPQGRYECFFVIDGPDGQSTASLVGNSANYSGFSEFEIAK